VCSSAKVVLLTSLVLVALSSAVTARADGSFRASDDELTGIWQGSVKTATDAVSPAENLDPRDCIISLPEVVLDSPIRDRCPYIGDLAVTGMTLLVSQSSVDALRSTIEWFSTVQNPDGSIPDSPIFDHTQVLIDYNAYWVEAVYDYTLYTGDLTLLQDVMPHLVKLMNTLYPQYVEPDGILADWLRGHDYLFVFRAGPEVSYYDAQYIRALGLAAALATWDGDGADATAWLARQAAARAAFAPAFWDATAGAFSDTNANRAVHALDGNVFAILAGAATPQQAASALAYIGRMMSHPQGDAVVDTPGWNSTWHDDATNHISPFMGYFELLAMYAVGNDAGALDLIRREWGTMLNAGPGTMWESIDASTGQPNGSATDLDHGWSSGAAPALTGYVLGVLPASPGFATFTVVPHPAGLAAATGVVPTPHGDIQVYWQDDSGAPQISVTAPVGTDWANAPGGASAPVNTSAPAITGTVTPGTVLTATPGTWSGAAVVNAYQWATCPASGLGCVPVAGETSSTYTVRPGDEAGSIRVFVTGSNGSGSSSATAVLGQAPPPSSGGSGGGGGGGAAPTPAPAPPVTPPPAAPAPAPAPVTPAPLLPAVRGVSSTAGFRLVLKVTGSGRISPRSGVYSRGLRIRLTASPSRGWHFAGWSGRWCKALRPVCTVTMTQAKDVRALFVRNRRR
jgi:hypothetical protein